MRILQINHWKHEHEYNCGPFFARRGDRVDELLLFAGEPEPDPRVYGGIIVYGGYMSAYDDVGHPWILRELRFLESCMKAGTPLLGICLGSQLLARLLGARIYRSPVPEFGFRRLRLNAEGERDPVLGRLGAGSPDRGFLAMEWHSDAWDLPAGATLLASGEQWPNQAFRYGDCSLAIQFHLEFTQEHISAILSENPGAAAPDPEGEAPAAFAAPSPRYDEARRNYELLLEGFLGQGLRS